MDDDETKGSFSDAPPSYDDSIIQHPGGGTSSTQYTSGSGSGSESATSHLQNHIASLPGRIRASQQARTAQQKLDDTLLVDHIAPAIEEFLIDLGEQGDSAGTPLATLTIIPDGAVPPQAELSGLAEMRRRGELGRVSRIRLGNEGAARKEKESKEKDNPLSFSEFTFASTASSSSSPFSSPDYNNAAPAADADLLWWRDEAMARRLAGCLQPKAATAGEKQQAERIRASTSAVQTAVEMELPPEKQKRGWGWGKWRTGRESPALRGAAAGTETKLNPRPQQQQQQQQQQKTTQSQGQDGAHMIVQTQEVAFRVENDLGILESIRGWGIVVTVDVNRR